MSHFGHTRHKNSHFLTKFNTYKQKEKSPNHLLQQHITKPNQTQQYRHLHAHNPKNILYLHKTYTICYNQTKKGAKQMATSKEYKEFILEQLNLLNDITCRAMMGEYLLYYNNILFGGIYDNRLLIKIVNSNKKYNMEQQIPYEHAKPMYLISNIDNKEILKEIILETCKDLPIKKSNKKGKKETMKNLLIEYPKCSTCQKAKKWLEQNKVDFIVRNIVTETPTIEELTKWIQQSEIEIKKWFNTSGLKYKALNLKDRLPNIGDKEKIELLASDGMLIKRPILITNKGIAIGFKEEKWRNVI